MNHDDYPDGPRLLAGIGGTNARFALERGPGRIAEVVAIANPVGGDLIRMTNHHWQFSIAEARADLGLDTLLLVHDFAALAVSAPGLGVAGLLPSADDPDSWTVLASEGGHVAFSPADEREQRILSFCFWFAKSPFRARFEHPAS